jgi:EAL domain-containing protein (putative c-di-GMP-specific phosphodiesterase class I)
MQEELIAANGLRADLERAVEQREFEVYYQPVLRVDNGQLEGAEALVRWRHPQRGLVAPAEFISFAEQSGLIVPIGRFVLRTACQQAADWIRQHPEQDDFTMNVNLSPAQMRSSDVVDDVASALQAANLDPRHLVLEITEGMLIEVDRFEGMLNELRAMGVRLALDDFGTGYSSLSYLGRLPFTTLKIDRSFFLALAANRPEGALIAVIQQIASSLNMTTVAEGIEGVEQLDYLRKLGVDLVQSFSTGRPVSATDFAAAFA